MKRVYSPANLPADGFAGTIIGRVWIPAALTGTVAGHSPALITEVGVYDLNAVAPTSPGRKAGPAP